MGSISGLAHARVGTSDTDPQMVRSHRHSHSSGVQAARAGVHSAYGGVARSAHATHSHSHSTNVQTARGGAHSVHGSVNRGAHATSSASPKACSREGMQPRRAPRPEGLGGGEPPSQPSGGGVGEGGRGAGASRGQSPRRWPTVKQGWHSRGEAVPRGEAAPRRAAPRATQSLGAGLAASAYCHEGRT